MTKEEYVLLYEKYTSGNCTEQEKKLFEAYTDEFSLEDSTWDDALLGDKKEITDRIYSGLQHEIHKKKRTNWFSWSRISAAAAVLLVLGSGIYYAGKRHNPDNLSANQTTRNLPIKPGSKKAILTLQDGSTILLDGSKSGVVANQGKTVIVKNKDGQIVYQPSEDQKIAEVYNSIATPRGGEAQLLLPDGTKVWLNAASSLKFPTVFCGDQRKVELTGEAYFEVAENKKMPFKVMVRETEVEVLGTHFNINAYEDKQKVNTTLLQGSVKLKNSDHQVMLKPGQSGLSSPAGAMKVRNVDVDDAVAWKNGYMVFHNEDIYSIMANAARWYDVEVEYQGEMKGKGFWGNVKRYDNIDELLKNLELTKEVHFKIEGRRVIVMSK